VETSQKFQLKLLIFILVSILLVEWLQKVIIPRALIDPMIVLGTARLLQVILILLIVVIWGKGLESIGLACRGFFLGSRRA
jgi:hypothetical protein